MGRIKSDKLQADLHGNLEKFKLNFSNMLSTGLEIATHWSPMQPKIE